MQAARPQAAGSAQAPLAEVFDVSDEHAAVIRKACAAAFEAALQSASVYGELSRRIRGDVEKGTGLSGWSVVVGRSFGAGLSHRCKHYAHVQSASPGVSVLVWRS